MKRKRIDHPMSAYDKKKMNQMKKGGKRKQVEDPRDEQTPSAGRHLGKGYNIGGRANLLEEMGRIDAEKMNPNRRAEKHRVIGELNKGYKSGGAVLKGKKVGCQIK